MFTLKKVRDRKGFTIVELLIVIVVIGILAALVITTYSGIQGRARDDERQTDLKALQGKLEAFYADNNYYPSASDLNDSTWRGKYMKGLSDDALADPQNADTQTLKADDSTTDPTAKVYGYVVTGTGDSVTDPDGNTATGYDNYTLVAKLESGKVYTLKSLD